MRTETEFPESNLSADASADRIGEPPAPSQQNIPPPLPSATVEHMFGSPSKEKKTADELAAMILADLRQIEGCPERGVKVVVYGFSPWHAWLSFGTDAGPVRNKADLIGFFDIITERLKRLYDIAF
jgi:hypothetical protein